MSILVKEYNKANFKEVKPPIFYSEVKVSIIDIYSSNKVEVICNDYVDCICKKSSNLSTYFKECDNCNGKGYVFINGHKLICNECKGEKLVRVKDCYLCSNKGKLVLENKIEIQLDSSLIENREIIIDKKDYKLVLKLDIYDLNDYYFKDDNIYYLKTIYYSKEDKINHKKVEINTIKGINYIESEFKVNKEIVTLKGCGLNNKDFYFTFENQIDKNKKEVYTNVIGDSGYALIDSLINDQYVFLNEFSNLKDKSAYIDKNTDKLSLEDYLIYLNRLDQSDFIKLKDNAYLKVELTKDDKDSDRKVITINNENINLTFKKNSKEVQEVEIYSKLVKDKQGKRDKLKVLIYPYFDNIYKISVKNNKNSKYIEDYHYYNYELVDAFKIDKYLVDPINIENKDEIILNNDLIKIRRVD